MLTKKSYQATLNVNERTLCSIKLTYIHKEARFVIINSQEIQKKMYKRIQQELLQSLYFCQISKTQKKWFSLNFDAVV